MKSPPLGSIVVRECAVFYPQVIVSKNKQVLEVRLKRLLQHLIYLKRLPSHKFGDIVVTEYIKLKDELETSSVDLDSIDRLDVFYFHAMKVRSKYPSLAKLLELMLTLSHGQADVERGFSTNKSVIEDNISELSVVSKRLVRDHYNANKSFEVNQKVIISCRHARSRYTEYLKEKRDLANETLNEAAREILNSERLLISLIKLTHSLKHVISYLKSLKK